MIRLRAFKGAILCPMFLTALLCAADFSKYRGFEFGTNLATAAKQAGVQPSEARLVHQRPAVIQELDWRPGSPYQADAEKVDPVREGLLRFYNGQLFQIVITYDRQKLEGLTEAEHRGSHLVDVRTSRQAGGRDCLSLELRRGRVRACSMGEFGIFIQSDSDRRPDQLCVNPDFHAR